MLANSSSSWPLAHVSATLGKNNAAGGSGVRPRFPKVLLNCSHLPVHMMLKKINLPMHMEQITAFRPETTTLPASLFA